MESSEFMDQVPPDVRRLFRENDSKKKPVAEQFRGLLRKKMPENILEYSPTFDSFTYAWKEGVNTNAQKAAKEVRLTGLEEFGEKSNRPKDFLLSVIIFLLLSFFG